MGLYLHVPFCSAKCGYCAFFSVRMESGLVRSYSGALETEIRLTAADPSVEGRAIATVYVGGGTPSALPCGVLDSLLQMIFETYAFENDVEITIEANPESLGDEQAGLLGSLPGARLSLGAQSFQPDVLRTLGRRHDPGAVLRSVQRARGAGVKNVALDLIYGSPGETLQDWEATLATALQLSLEHISCYCLSIEKETPLAKIVRAGRLHAPDETVQREMYDTARATLVGAGYEHYEVSNFALPGRRCRHNMGYWRRGPYLGLGPSAHSFIGGVRRRNRASVTEYCGELRSGAMPVDRSEKISRRQSLEETVMLALRTSDGLDMEELESTWQAAASVQLRARAAPLIENGLIEMDGPVMRIPASSYFVSDEIITRLLDLPGDL